MEGIVVPSDAAQRLSLEMRAVAVALSEVVVTPGHFGIAQEAMNKPETLNREQIETLPQLAEDIYRTVNRLPGISSSEMSAKFSVRGGDASTVLVTLDGLELYEPFHLKDFDGALSILDVAAIGGVDLTTGGFSAEYGNRLTGVFDLRTNNQLLSRPRTSIGVSLSNIRMMSQGSFDGGKGLWLFSGRRGYLDILLKLAGQSDKLNPRYYDALAKVVYQLSPKHRIEVHALRADDSALLVDSDDEGTVRSSYGSTYAWVNWVADPRERLNVTTQLSAGWLDWNRAADEQSSSNDFTIRDARGLALIGAKQDWRLSLSDRVALKWGIEAKHGTADYDYYNRIGRVRVESGRVVNDFDSTRTILSPTNDEVSGYLAPRFRPWTPLTLETGLRVDRQSLTNQVQVSPRVNAAFALDSRTTLRGAVGRYTQPHELFELQVQDGEKTFYPAARAMQMVAGLERDVGIGITTRLEVYRRYESDLRPIYRNVVGRIEPVGEIEADRARLDRETGRAQGAEAFVQRHTPRSSWSISYAVAHSMDRLRDGKELDRPLDQRHTIYADYSLAPAPAWRLSWAWQYHSGWPTTESSYRVDTLSNGGIRVTRTLGAPYAGRLPSYHRMDLRATRSFDVGRGRLSAFLDVFNLYNRKNPLAFAYNVGYSRGALIVRREIEPLLPILPTIGATWEF
jgi:hypothetical protein